MNYSVVLGELSSMELEWLCRALLLEHKTAKEPCVQVPHFIHRLHPRDAPPITLYISTVCIYIFQLA